MNERNGMDYVVRSSKTPAFIVSDVEEARPDESPTRYDEMKTILLVI